MARSSWFIASLAVASSFVQAIASGPAGLRDLTRRSSDESTLIARQDGGNQTAAPLECFEVDSPVLTPKGLVVGAEIVGDSPIAGTPSCDVLLMDHHFAYSYGQPFVADYTPPDNCPFNRVVLNFTVVSERRQFDRLAIMYLNDIEIWRTSTAEPKQHPGIHWTYWKDVTPFLSLWRQPQTLIFDLGNIVDDTYTGLFNTTLTATFFHDDLASPHAAPPDLIIPVSARRGSEGAASSFTYPETQAVNNITLPRNIRRAVFSVAANGQGAEEFWWSNVPQSSAAVFNASAGLLTALSSFREVRLAIDGRLAGLSWPFPVVFTGGISPPLHRPIVGIEAFDLREQEIDITPWLGLLCDGKEHEFSIDVVGVDDTTEPKFATVPQYWVLTGKIFIWLDDDENSVTVGSDPKVSINGNNYVAAQDVVTNEYLAYNQTIGRTVVVKSQIKTQRGISLVSWAQDFSMASDGIITDSANTQIVDATYGGTHKASLNGLPYFATEYKYPIYADYSYKSPDGDYDLSLTAVLTQGLQLAVTGQTAYTSGIEPFLSKLHGLVSGSSIDTTRNGTAFFYQYNNGQSSAGFGSVNQQYKFGSKGLLAAINPGLGIDKLLYSRDVAEVNETTTKDSQYVYGSESKPQPPPHHKGSSLSNIDGTFAPVPKKAEGLLSIFDGKDAAAHDQVSTSNNQNKDQEEEREDKRVFLRNQLVADW